MAFASPDSTNTAPTSKRITYTAGVTNCCILSLLCFIFQYRIANPPSSAIGICKVNYHFIDLQKKKRRNSLLQDTSSLYRKPHQRDVMKLRKNRIWEHPQLCNPPGREDTFSGWGPPLLWIPASAFHIKLKSIPINFDVAIFQWPFRITNLVYYCRISKCFHQKKSSSPPSKASFRAAIISFALSHNQFCQMPSQNRCNSIACRYTQS